MTLQIDDQPDMIGPPPVEDLPGRRRAEREFRAARDRLIAIRYAGGETLQELGDSFGLTGERVRQIVERFVASGVISRRSGPRRPGRAWPPESRTFQDVEALG